MYSDTKKKVTNYNTSKQVKTCNKIYCLIAEIKQAALVLIGVVCIASVLLITSGSAKSEHRNSFASMDQYKSQIYNILNRIDQMPKESNINNKQVLGVKMKTDINKNAYNQYIDQINHLEQESSQIYQELGSQKDITGGKDEFNKMLSDLDSFIIDTKLYYENYYIFNNITTNIQNKSIEIIQNDLLTLTNQIPDLHEEINKLKRLGIADEDWIKELENFTNSVTATQISLENSEEIDKNLINTKKYYQKVFQPTFKTAYLLKNIETAKYELLMEIGNFEQWQSNYIKSENSMRLESGSTIIIKKR